MSVGTRQFVLPPDSKSSFLHGGRIASVIRELQGIVQTVCPTHYQQVQLSTWGQDSLGHYRKLQGTSTYSTFCPTP
jgi:hypothetical protein